MKNRIKKRLTIINGWCEDNAELMMGFGVGLMAGSLVALRCILQTERDLETKSMRYELDGPDMTLRVIRENNRGETERYHVDLIPAEPEE